MRRKAVALATAALCLGAGAASAQTQPPAAPAADCPITHDQLATALKAAVKPSGGPSNGGLDNNEWAAIVNRDGNVCAVAFSGASWKDQWLGSRPIAVEKANTALSFSLDGMAMSTANLYAGAQPEGDRDRREGLGFVRLCRLGRLRLTGRFMNRTATTGSSIFVCGSSIRTSTTS